LAVSLINLNAMLTCANNATSATTSPGFRASKPDMFQDEPILIAGKAFLDKNLTRSKISP